MARIYLRRYGEPAQSYDKNANKSDRAYLPVDEMEFRTFRMAVQEGIHESGGGDIWPSSKCGAYLV